MEYMMSDGTRFDGVGVIRTKREDGALTPDQSLPASPLPGVVPAPRDGIVRRLDAYAVTQSRPGRCPTAPGASGRLYSSAAPDRRQDDTRAGAGHFPARS